MKNTKKLTKTLNTALIVLLCFTINTVSAQNVNVIGALTGNGTYPTLGAAFTAINAGAQTGATVTVLIDGSTVESTSAVLNAGTWAGLIIASNGGASRNITANIDGPVIDLNGASRVVIHGQNTGGNALTISNTNNVGSSASVIRFINDASNNYVSNCTISGSSTGANAGTIVFSTGIASGNDNNTITDNIITSAGANLARYAIYASGTLGFENSGNTITNNTISDFYSATAISVGINVASNNTDWTISGNKLFQTATRNHTTANTHRGIQIAGGNNYSIFNNTIGYSAANSTGTYSLTGTIATRFIAIDVSVGTSTASSIQGNTITAISLNTSSGATTTNGIICGINVTAGNVSIGTNTANTIGGTSGTDLIKAISTTANGMVVGINCSSTGTVAIQNNTIGGLSSSGTSASVSGNITGINISGVTGNLTISGNTIGNTTTDNMRGGTSGLTTGSSAVSGINLPSTSTGIIIISSNVIQNLSSFGTNTAGYVRGIWTAAATGNVNTYSITNNTISNLSSNSSLTSITSGQAGALGINISIGTNGVVSGNIITNIALTATVSTGNFAAGITCGNATSSKILNNKIYNIINAGTSVSATAPNIAAGIIIRSGATDITVANNFISLGNGSTNNTAFIGIMGNHGSTPDPINHIYFNTVNIEGTVTTGAQPSFGFLRGDLSTTVRPQTVNVKNNIITNTRTGGTGQHFAIANNYGNAGSTTGWTSNNNVLNANAATVGYLTSAQTFSGWKMASSSDANSFSGITVTYVNSANDLHLNMGVSPTLIESNGQAIGGITTDIDNQNRPGPSGSVNGGGLAPDIGADEIDGAFIDVFGPEITYTILPTTCSTADRILSATITDLSGVPTTGALQPRIYFKKNSGTWFSSQGTLTSGTNKNGTWDFNISTATMGGLTGADIVSYFVIAQDINAAISSNPSTGLVATDVNTISTPPTSPNTYLINTTLSGLYTIGTTGTYTTLTAAANAYNTSCLSGPVEFSLIDATYPSETFPIAFLSNPDANSTNQLTIKPAVGVSPTITGSSATSIINIVGGDYITINGSNSNTVNSICPLVKASRDLTISNTNSGTNSAVISIETSATGNGAMHNHILNSTVSGNTNSTTLVGINISGPTIGSGTGAVNNSYNTVINNYIKSAQGGIFSSGDIAPNSNNQFDLNDLNGVGSASLGRIGIAVAFEDSTKIRSNTIENLNFTGSNDAIAISIGTLMLSNTLTNGSEVTNAIVTGNTINNVTQDNTYSAAGIVLAATSTGTTLIANNMINNVFSNGTSPDFACGIYYGGGTGVLNIYHNSVNVTGSTLTGADQPNMALAINDVTPHVTIKNNILVCTGDNGFAGNTGIGLAYTSTVGNYANLVSSNNDIFVSGTGSSIGRVGSLSTGTQKITLTDWQTETGRDLNSVNVNPIFVSTTDLHLVASSNAGIENGGTSISAITTDINCETRSSNPDMGADEVCTNPAVATIAASNTVICSATTITLTVATGTLNDATAWHWYSASCAGTAVGTGTSIIVSPTTTSTYFVRGEGGCVTAALCSSLTINVNALPTVSVTSGAICNGQSFTITPSGASTYTITGGNFIVNPTSNASYNVTGTSSAGCVSSNTAVSSVTVNAVPTVSVNSGIICAGESFTITPSGASTYTITGGNFVVNPASNASYNVTGTSVAGCVSSNTAVSSVTVNALPSVSVSSGAICNGQSFTITPSGANTYTITGGNFVVNPTSNASYNVTGTSAAGCVSSNTAVSSVTVNALPSVSVTSGAICNGQSFTITPSGASTYTITGGNFVVNPTSNVSYNVTGTSTEGCVSSNAAVSSVTVNALPIISVISASICAGATGTLTANGADTYTWNTGAHTNIITDSPVNTTVYTVNGTSAEGCLGTLVSGTITVGSAPSIVVNSASICAGSSATLIANGVTTYTWSTGENSSTIIVSPTTNTVYTVNGDLAGCGVGANNSSTVTVNALPILTATTNNTLLCSGQTASLSVTGASTYTWSTTETMTVIAVSPSTQTTYTVNGTDANGCSNSTTITQDVSICTDLESISSTISFHLYPNPTNGSITISTHSVPNSISITDLLGQEIFNVSPDSLITNINLNEQPNGVYIVKVISGNTQTKKRVVLSR